MGVARASSRASVGAAGLDALALCRRVFGYRDSSVEQSEPVAIWAFDQDYFRQAKDREKDPPVEIWDDFADLQVNARAVEQEAVFMRVNKPGAVTTDLETHLAKFLLPAGIAGEALVRLASMGITARKLFRDLDHAAQTAAWRVRDAQA